MANPQAKSGSDHSKNSKASFNEFENPTHPDAIAHWPVLFPYYQQLLNWRFDLEVSHPRLSRLCHRMAAAFREEMIDTELGLLNAHPERRVQRAKKARAA